jgi:hypothetical protein
MCQKEVTLYILVILHGYIENFGWCDFFTFVTRWRHCHVVLFRRQLTINDSSCLALAMVRTRWTRCSHQDLNLIHSIQHYILEKEQTYEQIFQGGICKVG